ncbi:hypothetical protein [Tateyamaria omphalii]|uniref:hypothetical protein n=1 Tax=Tateyamaria omphalii TaxID=299262 RepID=UPI00167B0441|nr:hypothetical protein [Tateyamaria omphalii]
MKNLFLHFRTFLLVYDVSALNENLCSPWQHAVVSIEKLRLVVFFGKPRIQCSFGRIFATQCEGQVEISEKPVKLAKCTCEYWPISPSQRPLDDYPIGLASIRPEIEHTE